MTGGPGHCLAGFELQLMDTNRRLYAQRVHERSFAAFEASGMILLQKNGNAGTGTSIENITHTEATLQDVAVNGWSHLQQIHNPTSTASQVYQLYPRRARTTRAFEAILSMCAEPGTPFTLHDRMDPVEAKCVLRAKEIDTINEYNSRNRWKYTQFNLLHFDGILASQKNKTVAFLTTGITLNHGNAYLTHQLLDFIRFWIPKVHPDNKGGASKYEALLKLCNDKPFMITAIDVPPGRDLIRGCIERGIYVMQRQMINSMRFGFVR